MPDFENLQTQPLRKSFDLQILTMAPEISIESKSHQQLVEKELIFSLLISAKDANVRKCLEPMEESKFSYVPHARQLCSIQTIREAKSGQRSNDWKKCNYSHTSHESLAVLFWTSYCFKNDGQFLNVSMVILELIGDCHCEGGSRTGYTFPHGEFCKYEHCTCSNVAFVCNICSRRGISYCPTCGSRYVDLHLCRGFF